jgi:hypothetical protein
MTFPGWPIFGNIFGKLVFPGLPTFRKHGFQSFYFSKQHDEEVQTENVFKVLSRPKSINSFHSHDAQAKRHKTRPNTAVPVIPSEPEQPKAHPRITSGKPRPPTRGIINGSY